MDNSKIYWQEIAQTYNNIVGEKGDIMHEKVINPIVIDFLGDLKGKVVFDAGCGNGYMSRILSKTASRVVGVDFTERLIKLARQCPNPSNLEFFVDDLEKLKFPNNTFDVILCNMVLMDVERMSYVIMELSRVLKRDGTLVISTIHPCFENPPYTYSIVDSHGELTGRVVRNYFETGLVIDEKQNVVKGQFYQHYHYMLQDYLNTFSRANLFLEKTSEPNDFEILGVGNSMNPHTPTFIILKLRKI